MGWGSKIPKQTYYHTTSNRTESCENWFFVLSTTATTAVKNTVVFYDITRKKWSQPKYLKIISEHESSTVFTLSLYRWGISSCGEESGMDWIWKHTKSFEYTALRGGVLFHSSKVPQSLFHAVQGAVYSRAAKTSRILALEMEAALWMNELQLPQKSMNGQLDKASNQHMT